MNTMHQDPICHKTFTVHTFDILIILGWKGILSKPTCLSMASKITFNQSLFVPKHYALHTYLIKEGSYLVNTLPIKFPLLLAPTLGRPPAAGALYICQTTTKSMMGGSSRLLLTRSLMTYHSKLCQQH